LARLTCPVPAQVMQSFSITCVVTLLWLIFGYSMSFDPGNPVVGGPNKIWLQGMVGAEVGTLPESLFVTFQGTFAVITAAIITGSFAERMRFGPMLIFIGIWHLIVYCPLCHWEWGGGFVSIFPTPCIAMNRRQLHLARHSHLRPAPDPGMPADVKLGRARFRWRRRCAH
jgi:ammonia channel protein AmtB